LSHDAAKALNALYVRDEVKFVTTHPRTYFEEATRFGQVLVPGHPLANPQVESYDEKHWLPVTIVATDRYRRTQ
jgi:hypothetical protein